MVTCDQQAANVWVARIIPVILIGIVSYASWVVVAKICVEYLLRASTWSSHGPRRGVGIAILTVYFILLLPMAATYFRLLETIATNPGFVPRSALWHQRNGHKSQTGTAQSETAGSLVKEKSSRPWKRQSDELEGGDLADDAVDSTASQADSTALAPGLEKFYTKEVFVCEHDGRPRWCSTCLNWKPDRAHHCREVGRCVQKMDHFCPWVGGIVSETSFKFFLQFVAYAAVYCIFVLIFMAIFVWESLKETRHADIHWILTLAFAGLFGLFTLGMTASSVDLALRNCTTVENLTRKTKVYYLAVFAERAMQPQQSPTPIAPGCMRQTYPGISEQSSESSTSAASGTTAPRVTPPRPFIVLRTPPGESPWELGPYANWKSVMGDRVLDWFIPLKHSPCCDHSSGESAFALGPVVDRLRREFHLVPEPIDPAPSGAHRKSQRRRRRDRRRSRAADDAHPAVDSSEKPEARPSMRWKRARRRSGDAPREIVR